MAEVENLAQMCYNIYTPIRNEKDFGQLRVNELFLEYPTNPVLVNVFLRGLASCNWQPVWGFRLKGRQMNTPKYTYIYELKDPRDGTTRYVGKANNPKQRLRNHFSQSVNQQTPKALWMQELRALGLYPELSIVIIVPFKGWQYYERALIKQYRKIGKPLLNIHKGGGGGGEWDEAKRERYREQTRKMWNDPQYRQRVSEKIRASRTDEFLAEQSQRMLDMWEDEAYREKTISSMVAAWEDADERREAIRDRWAEQKQDDEFMDSFRDAIIKGWEDADERREAVSKSNGRLWSDPDHKAKRVKAIKKAARKPKTRKILSERMQARWDDPEERARLTEINRNSRTVEQGEETSLRNKELWSDPEHRARRCANISKSWTPERRAAQSERMRQRKRQGNE